MWKPMAEARAMMLDSEEALSPLLERYRHLIDPNVWEAYEDGRLAGFEVLEHTFTRHITYEEDWPVSHLN